MPRGQRRDVQERIIDFVRDRIALGKWSPGGLLPKRVAFEARFKASSRTVNKAFATLARDGWVKAVPHVGTRVVDPPPCAGRYLLMLNRAAPMLSESFRIAARRLAPRFGASFEEMQFPDDLPDAEELRLAIADAIHAHRWEGVVFTSPFVHMEPVLRRIRNAPVFGLAMLKFKEAGKYTAGSPSNSGWNASKVAGPTIERLFAECRRHGLRRVAILYSRLESPGRDALLREAAARHGLEAGPFHIQAASPDKSRAHLVEPLLRLMLRPDDPWRADAVILTDDNFVKPLESAVLALYGEDGLGRYAVFAHGNRPGLPETRLARVAFHGIDVEKTMQGFISFARACSRGSRRWVDAPQIERF